MSFEDDQAEIGKERAEQQKSMQRQFAGARDGKKYKSDFEETLDGILSTTDKDSLVSQAALIANIMMNNPKTAIVNGRQIEIGHWTEDDAITAKERLQQDADRMARYEASEPWKQGGVKMITAHSPLKDLTGKFGSARERAEGPEEMASLSSQWSDTQVAGGVKGNSPDVEANAPLNPLSPPGRGLG